MKYINITRREAVAALLGAGATAVGIAARDNLYSLARTLGFFGHSSSKESGPLPLRTLSDPELLEMYRKVARTVSPAIMPALNQYAQEKYYAKVKLPGRYVRSLFSIIPI